MDFNAYQLDVVVPHIKLEDSINIDPSKLLVQVQHHRLSTKISASKINVTQFPDKPGIVCNFFIEEIKYMVRNFPISFNVIYYNKQIGHGETRWPKKTLNQIHSAMIEIVHTGECQLKEDSRTVGVLGFMIRIHKQCEPVEKQLSSLQLKTELRKLIKDDNILGTYHDPRVCEVTKLNQMLNAFDKDRNKCGYEPIPCSECPPGLVEFTSSDLSTSTPKTVISAENVPCQCSTRPELLCDSLPDLKETVFLKPRLCLMCKQNISWLPTFTPCAYCGYKPALISEEQEYDDKKKATEIIEEYKNLNISCSETDQCYLKDTRPKNRCTCNGQGTCAYCRVQAYSQQIIAEVTKTPIVDKNCDKCTENSKQLYNVCTNVNCRPFMSRVLSLIDLAYQKQEEIKTPQHDCERIIKDYWDKNYEYAHKRKKNPKFTNVVKRMEAGENNCEKNMEPKLEEIITESIHYDKAEIAKKLK